MGKYGVVTLFVVGRKVIERRQKMTARNGTFVVGNPISLFPCESPLVTRSMTSLTNSPPLKCTPFTQLKDPIASPKPTSLSRSPITRSQSHKVGHFSEVVVVARDVDDIDLWFDDRPKSPIPLDELVGHVESDEGGDEEYCPDGDMDVADDEDEDVMVPTESVVVEPSHVDVGDGNNDMASDLEPDVAEDVLGHKQMARRERTSWTDDVISKLLDLLNELKNPRHGKFNWDQVVVRLNAQTERKFEKKQVENFYNDCKSKFKAWDELKTKWTGIGWDTETGCPVVDTTSDKWKAFITKYKGANNFLKRPLPFEKKMYDLFKGTIASGSKSWATSSMGPSLFDINKDVTIDVDEEHQKSGDENDDFKDDVMMVEHEVSGDEYQAPVQALSSKRRKSLDGSRSLVTKRNSKEDEIDTCMDVIRKSIIAKSTSNLQPQSLESKFQRMMMVLQDMQQVSMHEKNFILEVLEYLREADNGDFFLSLPDNEFRVLFLKKKIQFPNDYYIPMLDEDNTFN